MPSSCLFVKVEPHSIPEWPSTHYAVQADLKLTIILLSQTPTFHFSIENSGSFFFFPEIT